MVAAVASAQYLELSKEFYTAIAESYGDQPNIIYEPFNEPIGASGTAAESAYRNYTLKPYHEEIVAHSNASALLINNPPSSGGWKTEDLSEHGQLVRELLQAPRAQAQE